MSQNWNPNPVLEPKIETWFFTASFKPGYPEPESDFQNWKWNQNLNFYFYFFVFKNWTRSSPKKNRSRRVLITGRKEPEPEGLDSRKERTGGYWNPPNLTVVPQFPMLVSWVSGRCSGGLCARALALALSLDLLHGLSALPSHEELVACSAHHPHLHLSSLFSLSLSLSLFPLPFFPFSTSLFFPREGKVLSWPFLLLLLLLFLFIILLLDLRFLLSPPLPPVPLCVRFLLFAWGVFASDIADIISVAFPICRKNTVFVSVFFVAWVQ